MINREPVYLPKMIDLLPWRRKTTQDTGPRYYFGYGRVALYEGLRWLKMNPEIPVLCPETICDVCLAALAPFKVQVRYYRLFDDLTPDWDHVERLRGGLRGGCFIIVNYFGFVTGLDRARSWCQQTDFTLIEDNAHGAGSQHAGRELGGFGDLSITSPRKVLPILNGAYLQINKTFSNLGSFHPHDYPVETLSIKRWIKQNLKFLLEKTNLSLIKLRPWPEWEKMPPVMEHDFPAYGIDDRSRSVIEMTDWTNLRQTRQQLYRAWQDVLPPQGFIPVFRDLPEGVSPLCYPCYTQDVIARLRYLKIAHRLDLDLFPWPSLPQSLRADSSAAARWYRLLCFPINQHVSVEKIRMLQKTDVWDAP